MRYYIIAITSALMLMATCTLALGANLAHAATPSAKCAEDDVCWNWATMGNQRRGIVTMHGTPMVVGPCRFQRLMRAGVVDYRTSDVMRGDRTAMRKRCR